MCRKEARKYVMMNHDDDYEKQQSEDYSESSVDNDGVRSSE